MRIQNSGIPNLKKQVQSSSAVYRRPTPENFGAIASDTATQSLQLVRQTLNPTGQNTVSEPIPIRDRYGKTYLSVPNGIILTEANLSQYDLSNTYLAEIPFDEADFRGADLSGADLENAYMVRTDFQGANLSGAKLSKSTLNKANLRAANLRGADLRAANLEEADLHGTDLEGANLNNADLANSNLSKAKFTQTDLTNTSLVGANLREVDLSGAKLNGADFSKADLKGTKLPKSIGTNLFSFSQVSNEGSIGEFLKVLDLLLPKGQQKITIKIPQPYDPDFPLITKPDAIPESSHNHYLSFNRTKEGHYEIKYNDNESNLLGQGGTKINCKFKFTPEEVVAIKDQSFISSRIRAGMPIKQNDGVGWLSATNFQALKQDLLRFFASETSSLPEALQRTLIVQDENGKTVFRQNPSTDGLSGKQIDGFHGLLTGKTFKEQNQPQQIDSLETANELSSYEFSAIASDPITKNIHAVNQTFLPNSQQEAITPNIISESTNDLSGMDLKEADLHEAKLEGVDLSGANLERAVMSRANLSNANLSNANLNKAKLFKANLSGADLINANLQFADLEESNLGEANLNNANLQGAYLEIANLNNANLQGANLSPAHSADGQTYNRTILRKANLAGANLTNADLRGADLESANLNNANLSDANLSISKERIGQILYRYNTNLRIASLTGANLTNADLRGANLNGTNLFKANFLNANVQPFPFNGSFNKEVDYANPAFIKRENGDIALPTQIQQTDLTKANLKGADLSEANLTGTQLPISLTLSKFFRKLTSNFFPPNKKPKESSVETVNLDIVLKEVNSPDTKLPTNVSTDQNSQKDRPKTDPKQGDGGTPVVNNKPKIPNQPDSGGEKKAVEEKIAQPSTDVAENTNNSSTSEEVDWESLKQNSNRTEISGAGEIAVVTETENQSFNRMDSRVFTGEQKVVPIPAEADDQQELEITGESSRSLSGRQVETVSV